MSQRKTTRESDVNDHAPRARNLYAVYLANSGGVNYQGKPCPEWHSLPARVQACWIAVARFTAEATPEPTDEVLTVSGEDVQRGGDVAWIRRGIYCRYAGTAPEALPAAPLTSVEPSPTMDLDTARPAEPLADNPSAAPEEPRRRRRRDRGKK